MEQPAPKVDGFSQVWALYPRREAKKDAQKAWQQVRADQHLEAIVTAVEWQKETDGWRRGYVPYLGTYLRGERWNDERPRTAADPLAPEYEAWRTQHASDPQAALVTFEQFKRYVQRRRQA